MARELKVLETNLKFEEIIKFISYFCRLHCVYDHNCFVLTFFIFRKRYSIGEVLRRIFFLNPGIAKVLAVERDVKPRRLIGVNMDKYGTWLKKYQEKWVSHNLILWYITKQFYFFPCLTVLHALFLGLSPS